MKHFHLTLEPASASIPDPAGFSDALTRWFRKNRRDLPWRRTRDPYAILVSEMMLQQTQVKTVIPYFNRWMKRFSTVQALAEAPESEVLSAWEGLGYYSRARNLHAAAKVICEKHRGVFPSDLAALRDLPGVGRYSAGAVASFAFDQPTAAVDSNVARVIARVADIQESIDATAGAEATWRCVSLLMPETGGRELNSSLMELGALVCTARNPGCDICPVRSHCRCADPLSLPRKKARAKTIRREERCALVFSGSSVLLEQETKSRWRGLWRLPDLHAKETGGPLLQLDFPFTHHLITLMVFSENVTEPAPGQRLVSFADLPKMPMPSPHRRAVEQLVARHLQEQIRCSAKTPRIASLHD